MKSYPSIRGPLHIEPRTCYGFVKYDGSNLRFEWSKKRGWYKFGTRQQLFDISHKVFGKAIELFKNKYDDSFTQVFRQQKFDNVIVFGEFFGNKSFAGQHQEDDVHDIVVFDVNVLKRGFFGPEQFLDLFGTLGVSELLYTGEYNSQLIEDVREERINVTSSLPIQTVVPEGMVFKGGSGHDLWMSKVKTHRYKAKLKEVFETNWQNYWE